MSSGAVGQISRYDVALSAGNRHQTADGERMDTDAHLLARTGFDQRIGRTFRTVVRQPTSLWGLGCGWGRPRARGVLPGPMCSERCCDSAFPAEQHVRVAPVDPVAEAHVESVVELLETCDGLLGALGFAAVGLEFGVPGKPSLVVDRGSGVGLAEA